MLSTSSEEVSARSQWLRHAVTGRAFFSQEVYHDHSVEDANVFGVEGAGRYDISGDASLDLSGSFVQQPQRRDSPQADLALIGRPIYNTVTGALGYNQQWGRFQNQAQFGMTKTAYVSADDFGRNGTELRYRDRVSFALTGELWPFVEGVYSTQNWPAQRQFAQLQFRQRHHRASHGNRRSAARRTRRRRAAPAIPQRQFQDPGHTGLSRRTGLECAAPHHDQRQRRPHP